MERADRADMLVAVPVKPFGVAKRRLAPVLDPVGRRRLGRAVAARTIVLAASISTHPVVVTGDSGVGEWAARLGVAVVREEDPGGLDMAATAAVTEAARLGLPWMILHADLPLVVEVDLLDVVGLLGDADVVLAPSHDGGTNVVAGVTRAFAFAFGPGSFRRHLARVAHLPHRVLVRPGLALDLDGPHDLRTAQGIPAGRWLAELLGPRKTEAPV